MNQLETLMKENQNLRKALLELLKIDYSKPILLDIDLYELVIYANLDQIKRLRNDNRENPILYETIDNYFKETKELSYQFVLDLKIAKEKQQNFLNRLTTQ